MRSTISRLILLTTITGSFWAAGPTAEAAHVCRRYYLDQFEIAIRELDGQLRAEKERLRCRFEETRDALRYEIRHVSRRLDGYERDRALRHLHHQLADADRCYHRDLRRLHADYHERRRQLARERDCALRDCQTTHCTDACRIGDRSRPPHSYFAERPHRSRPYQTIGNPDFAGPRRNPHHAKRDFGPPPSDRRHAEMDWQRMLLGLLGQHWSR